MSILFGVFNYFRFINFHIDVNIEQFVTLALFFVVAVLYRFLSERLTQDAKRVKEIIEENRIAEAMVEMTRALSSSLNGDHVLYLIVRRACEVLEASDYCVGIDSKDGGAKVLVKASDPENQNIGFDLDKHPGLKQAYGSRRLLFIPDARPLGIIAIPMIAQKSVLG